MAVGVATGTLGGALGVGVAPRVGGGVAGCDVDVAAVLGEADCSGVGETEEEGATYGRPHASGTNAARQAAMTSVRDKTIPSIEV